MVLSGSLISSAYLRPHAPARIILQTDADTSAITERTSTIEKAPDAVILLTSSSSLSDECTEVERSSAPSWVLDDAPDAYKAKTVLACGDWSVIPTDDGWFGWTPNSDEERTAAAR